MFDVTADDVTADDVALLNDADLRALVGRLCEAEMRKRLETTNAIEGNKKKIEWGSQIRNYVLHPYKLVKDLRTDYETSNAQAVLDGDLNDFLKAYLPFGVLHQQTRELS